MTQSQACGNAAEITRREKICLGFVVAAAGAMAAGPCIATFVTLRRGTPAPFDPPREFVASGPNATSAIQCMWALPADHGSRPGCVLAFNRHARGCLSSDNAPLRCDL